MNNRHAAADGGTVDAAFNRVLRAEAKAREALADCRAQADQRVTAAEQQVREISGRAERRIRASNHIADQGIARALEGLDADAERAGAAVEPDADTVEDLVTALAAELTGGQP
ncbi:hypothetical protein [Thiohalocapsa sp.]|uniref:hypothetical protein n=1 Tax=Thiohalocapsa sp. TaxID=2497641 RepID=UPI0025F182B5|nr:hypothetical protein [Thiohalocapsa sp.]